MVSEDKAGHTICGAVSMMDSHEILRVVTRDSPDSNSFGREAGVENSPDFARFSLPCSQASAEERSEQVQCCDLECACSAWDVVGQGPHYLLLCPVDLELAPAAFLVHSRSQLPPPQDKGCPPAPGECVCRKLSVVLVVSLAHDEESCLRTGREDRESRDSELIHESLRGVSAS